MYILHKGGKYRPGGGGGFKKFYRLRFMDIETYVASWRMEKKKGELISFFVFWIEC